jgi:rhamnopyranosyl-N-acetylglucosaminyl-diphospho-decaprenol beta-1,3/1,4-galactofuranosyltransferase
VSLERSRIVAVVVTHNREKLLERCLDYLQRQSRAPDRIVVINNGSTDGTERMLSRRGVPCITQENLGSAGGWHRGIEYALSGGFDAAWLMDDDGYPAPEALGRLEEALQGGAACVSSVVLREDDHSRLVFGHPVLDQKGLPVLFALKRKLMTLDELNRTARGGVYPFAHFFNGTLLSMDAVRRVGNLDRDFFIFGEEVDYFFRLKEAGAVFSLLAAHHFHPDVTQRPYSSVKVYYYIKNTLVLNRRYFDRTLQRDLMTIGAALWRTARRNGPGEALSYLAGSKAPSFYRAIVRGLRGRVGKDFTS